MLPKSEKIYARDRDYNVWNNVMLRSNRTGNYSNKFPTYSDCSCSESFAVFNTFKKWYVNQVGYDKQYHIDKDLLFEGNKIYSENTCILLPREINVLFKVTYSSSTIGLVGVTKCRERYRSLIADPYKGRQKHLGYFDTPEEAHEAYKMEKSNIILRLIEDYRYDLDPRAVLSLEARAMSLLK